MNKIEVTGKNEIQNNVDNIFISSNDNKLDITIKKSIDEPIVLANSIYNDITFIIKDDASINIFEAKDNNVINKVNYKYILGNNSKVIVNKFYYMNDYNEEALIKLNGCNANILFNLSVMSHGNHKYNINVEHNNKKTISNIYNHGVTFDNGTLDMIVNGIIKKGMSYSVLNQDNKIMTLGSGKSTIRPNLYIDENIVEAKHGASIGNFNEDELFYLEARGIPRKDGYYLLMKGFLLGTLAVDDNIRKELENIIEKYWR